MEHQCRGDDIWNGNSCILVHNPNTQVTVEECHVTSSSGRGVVATRGSRITLNESSIAECAATGMYLGECLSHCCCVRSPNVVHPGGTTTRGFMNDCVVTGNGRGGPTIARGHSGVFVDRCELSIERCRVQSNHLTGVSLIGDQSQTTITDSTIRVTALSITLTSIMSDVTRGT